MRSRPIRRSSLALLTDAQLLLDVDRLLYWAHWITPSNAPRRFDTRFFAIVVPAEQTAAIDTIEAVDHAWMTPAALLAAAARGEMPVSQPTLYNLMELDNSLREHGALAAMLRAESDQRDCAGASKDDSRGADGDGAAMGSGVCGASG